jgi:hypothetical protein
MLVDLLVRIMRLRQIWYRAVKDPRKKALFMRAFFVR